MNGIDRGQGEVINNCLTHNPEESDDIEMVTEERTRVIIYAGQINAQKGVSMIVDAAVELCRRYDDIFFHFWGANYDTEYTQQMCKTIEENNLQDRVIFVAMGKISFPNSNRHICIFARPCSRNLQPMLSWRLSMLEFRP